MKLGIATSVVVGLSPLGSASHRQYEGRRRRRERFPNIKYQEELEIPFRNPHRNYFSQQNLMFDYAAAKNADGKQQFQNKLPVLPDQTMECDPTADIGILECGTMSYCMEISTAKQTRLGVCVKVGKETSSFEQSHRQLEQDYYYGSFAEYACTEGNPYDYYDCDCSDFDLDYASGTISCYVEEYCISYCIPSVCYTQTINYISYQGSNILELQYEFTEPYEQSFVITYNRTDDGSFLGGSCEIELGTERCDSCTEYASGCVSYDCTNIGLGSIDCYDSFGYPIAPILQQCYDEPRPTSPPISPIVGECRICGKEVGNNVINGADRVYFPFIGDYTCEFIGDLADSGDLYDVACEYVTTLAQETCCPQSLDY